MNILNSIIFILFKQEEKENQIQFLLSFIKEVNIPILLNHIVENVEINFHKKMDLNEARKFLNKDLL
jgi:hypothetical protein